MLNMEKVEVNGKNCYRGICEFPNCNNEIISGQKLRKWCKDCNVERYKHNIAFYDNLKTKSGEGV